MQELWNKQLLPNVQHERRPPAAPCALLGEKFHLYNSTPNHAQGNYDGEDADEIKSTEQSITKSTGHLPMALATLKVTMVTVNGSKASRLA